MATNRTFEKMLNKKPQKLLKEDDMSQLPKGGLKLPKYKESTYSKMLKEKK